MAEHKEGEPRGPHIPVQALCGLARSNTGDNAWVEWVEHPIHGRGLPVYITQIHVFDAENSTASRTLQSDLLAAIQEPYGLFRHQKKIYLYQQQLFQLEWEAKLNLQAYAYLEGHDSKGKENE